MCGRQAEGFISGGWASAWSPNNEARLRVRQAGLAKSLLYVSAWCSSGVLNWSRPMTEGTRDQHLRALRCCSETLSFSSRIMCAPVGTLTTSLWQLSEVGWDSRVPCWVLRGRSQGGTSEYQLWLPNWRLPQTKIHDKLQYLPSLRFLMCVCVCVCVCVRGRGVCCLGE